MYWGFAMFGGALGCVTSFNAVREFVEREAALEPLGYDEACSNLPCVLLPKLLFRFGAIIMIVCRFFKTNEDLPV